MPNREEIAINREARALARRLERSPRDGKVANDLLDRFYRGANLRLLVKLLDSSDDDLVGAAAWMASELGYRIKPIFSQVAQVLGHRSKRARFWAIDGVLVCASSDDISAHVAVFDLLDDAEQAVRLQAINYLARLSLDMLRSIEGGMRSQGYHDHADLVRSILDAVDGGTEGIVRLLRSPSPLERRAGVATAARIKENSPAALQFAAQSEDSDVRDFAVGLLPEP